MTNVEDEYMKVDPEMERIWREDEDPSFTEIRSGMPDEPEVEEDEESEQPEDTAEPEDSEENEEDGDVEEETEDSEGADDSQPDEEEEKESEAKPESTSYKIKANQMELDLTVDELVKLAPKALDYTKKMQEIAPWRKSISALKESGMGEQEVNLMIDVLKGDKAAIAEVLKRTQVDPFELDTEAKEAYVPNQYGVDESVSQIQEIVNQIRREPEYMMTEQVIDEDWDSRSREIIKQNPDMIMGLHVDIKDGTYQKVAPLALKMKALDGGRLSDVEYYIEAGQRMFAQTEQQAVPETKQVVQKQAEERQADIKKMADVRKAASPTKRMSGKRDVIDYLNEDDESYDEWYKKITSV